MNPVIHMGNNGRSGVVRHLRVIYNQASKAKRAYHALLTSRHDKIRGLLIADLARYKSLLLNAFETLTLFQSSMQTSMNTAGGEVVLE